MQGEASEMCDGISLANAVYVEASLGWGINCFDQ